MIAVLAIVGVVIWFVLGKSSNKNEKNGKYVCEEYAADGLDVTLVVSGTDFVLKVPSKDGKYISDEYDITLDINGNNFIMKISAYGQTESVDGTIRFTGDKVELTAEGETLEGNYNRQDRSITLEGIKFKLRIPSGTEEIRGTIKFEDNKVELISEEETIEGDYNKEEKTITIDDMIFRKN